MYFRCGECGLIALAPQFLLTFEDQQQHYDHHRNDSRDPHYRAFLNQLCEPLLECLLPRSTGLDFGCGPGPTLSMMLEAVGHTVENYDPIYANYPERLNRQYDFITATEVFEHLHDPHTEIERLLSCLRPGGYLAVMTMHPPALANFEDWHYLIDPTHVVFYSQRTFAWIAEKWDLRCQFPTKNVTILQSGNN